MENLAFIFSLIGIVLTGIGLSDFFKYSKGYGTNWISIGNAYGSTNPKRLIAPKKANKNQRFTLLMSCMLNISAGLFTLFLGLLSWSS